MAIEQNERLENGQRSVLTLRLTDEQHARLKDAAFNANVSVNKYVSDRFDRLFDDDNDPA